MEVLIVMILGLLLLVICGVNRGEAVTCRTAGVCAVAGTLYRCGAGAAAARVYRG